MFWSVVRKARTSVSAAAAAALVVPLVACGTDGRQADRQREDEGDVAGATSSELTDNQINQVLAISVDGLRADAIARLGVDRAPNLLWLYRQGVRTPNARTAVEATRTLPNHTSMLTGRRIDTGMGGHGVTFNSDDGSTVHQAAGEYVASAFDRVHDRGWRTALYTSKRKFRFFNRSWNSTHGAPDRTGVDNGRDKIDRYFYRDHQGLLTDAVLADLRNGAPPFTLLHYAAPDRDGHRYGWMSPQYLDAVARTDAQIGRVLRLIRSRDALSDHLAVILTSDHGGAGYSHTDPTDFRTFRIPFIVWGPGVLRGVDIYQLNDDYPVPGRTQPPYGGPQPVRNGMLANLALDLLDLRRVPGATLNAKMDLDVSR